MLKTTKNYIYYLTVVVIIEIIYSVPLVVDYIGTKRELTPLLLIPVGMHVLGLLYVSIGYTEYYSITCHIIGIATIFTNMILILSFIPHLLIVIIGYNVLRKVNKKIKHSEKMNELKEELDLRQTYVSDSEFFDDEDIDIEKLDNEEYENYLKRK